MTTMRCACGSSPIGLLPPSLTSDLLLLLYDDDDDTWQVRTLQLDLMKKSVTPSEEPLWGYLLKHEREAAMED